MVVNARRDLNEAEAVAAEARGQGGQALALLVDVADADAATGMVAALDRFGRLDVLVNNAALRREAAFAGN